MIALVTMESDGNYSVDLFDTEREANEFCNHHYVKGFRYLVDEKRITDYRMETR